MCDIKWEAQRTNPVPAVKKPATFPATKTRADVQQACLASPFPNLAFDKDTIETLIPYIVVFDLWEYN
ncbi:hypothetical protein M422DRAFT_274846 [Sphaerobolus stellatus SS14]|uniref:Fungal ligninase C-terminal domain-containing protein n=1 Tax=Sphaerobolus stellatus (strain SS14) TaxID=990650 RepID=A0A0C9UGR8_SPHS4|nr:hypothetical protein M422DRAFT_274846 [Sphaerobolus stellatus SS14]